MSVVYILIVVGAVAYMVWRVRRAQPRALLSPSELGEVLGRSRDAAAEPEQVKRGEPLRHQTERRPDA